MAGEGEPQTHRSGTCSRLGLYISNNEHINHDLASNAGGSSTRQTGACSAHNIDLGAHRLQR